MKINTGLAIVFVVATFLLFAYIIYFKLGGEQALFLIIGHVAAWVEMIVIFYFRKKPSEGIEKKYGSQEEKK